MLDVFSRTQTASAQYQSLHRANARQRGVAVVTALLLTTLAVTIVASVFWQQQVQVRAVENQRSQSQTQWVMRAALDWTRIILREDARSTAVDQLGESWAVPLPETPLDDYLDEGSSGAQEVGGTLSGYVVDAQSRYNLRNLAEGGVVNPQELAVYRRLLGYIGVSSSLAEATATAIAASQAPVEPPPPKSGADTGSNPMPGTVPTAKAATRSSDGQPAALIHSDDLITVPGYTPDIIEKLKNYVVILPAPTPVNVNTAGKEVLAAKANLPLDQVGPLIASRSRAYFVDTMDFQNRAHMEVLPSDTDLSVKTHYFLIYNKVKWDRANLNMQALIYRKDTGNTTIKWLRE